MIDLITRDVKRQKTQGNLICNQNIHDHKKNMHRYLGLRSYKYDILNKSKLQRRFQIPGKIW